jgi:hypothetical protein
VLRPDRQQLALRIWELAIDSTGGYVYSRALLAGRPPWRPGWR